MKRCSCEQMAITGLHRLVNATVKYYKGGMHEEGNALYHHLIEEHRIYSKRGFDTGKIDERINQEIVMEYFHKADYNKPDYVI